MSDEQNGQAQEPTEPTTPAAAETPDSGTDGNAEQTESSIPYSRFQQAIAERNDLRDRLAALETAAEESQAAELAEQQRYQELYEQEKAARVADAERIATLQAQAQQSAVNGALREAALAAGFSDAEDALRFIDSGEIDLADGTPTNADALVAKLATERPYLVKSPGGTPFPAQGAIGGTPPKRDILAERLQLRKEAAEKVANPFRRAQ